MPGIGTDGLGACAEEDGHGDAAEDFGSREAVRKGIGIIQR